MKRMKYSGHKVSDNLGKAKKKSEHVESRAFSLGVYSAGRISQTVSREKLRSPVVPSHETKLGWLSPYQATQDDSSDNMSRSYHVEELREIAGKITSHNSSLNINAIASGKCCLEDLPHPSRLRSGARQERKPKPLNSATDILCHLSQLRRKERSCFGDQSNGYLKANQTFSECLRMKSRAYMTATQSENKRIVSPEKQIVQFCESGKESYCENKKNLTPEMNFCNQWDPIQHFQPDCAVLQGTTTSVADQTYLEPDHNKFTSDENEKLGYGHFVLQHQIGNLEPYHADDASHPILFQTSYWSTPQSAGGQEPTENVYTTPLRKNSNKENSTIKDDVSSDDDNETFSKPDVQMTWLSNGY